MNPASETADNLRAQGLTVETVGDLLGGAGAEPRTTPARFSPARLEGTPPVPEPGIYFGMSEEEYHAIPALSNTGIKKLAASPMIFWASTPWLSEQKRRRVEEAKESGDREHHVMGKAYHCRLMEGASAYAMRYAIALTPADFPDALESTDQIKAAISRHTQMQPVKPVGGKDDLDLQLRDLCARHMRDPIEVIPEGTKITVSVLKEAIATFEEEAPVAPVSKVPDVMPDSGEEYMRAAVKADWIAQLMALDPQASVFANIDAEYRASHKGKVFLTPDQHAEIEIAALMLERDRQLGGTFKGGHAEVTLIWYCRKTGVPMKARLDYLKMGQIVDLKSVANQRERSIENAIRWEIASYKYPVQPVVYCEGAEEVRRLIRESNGGHVYGNYEGAEGVLDPALAKWAWEWAQQSEPDEFMWVFQQKGAAPITRGVKFPRTGITDESTQYVVEYAKKRFIQFSEVFGVEPWLDVAPVYTIADEDIPPSATEI